MSGISVSKTGLKTSLDNFTDLSSKITKELAKVTEALQTIESNWTGPVHDSAKPDHDTAKENMEKATATLESMKGAIAQLSTNASLIEY